MSAITTHVLDTSRGQPAGGIEVVLERRESGHWSIVARAAAGADGRVRALLPDGKPAAAGMYRLTFESGAYFEKLAVRALYPEVHVVFELRADEAHCHLPLLLGPFSYCTYRGS